MHTHRVFVVALTVHLAAGCAPRPTPTPPKPREEPRAQAPAAPPRFERVVPYVPPRIDIPEEKPEVWFEPKLADVGGSARLCRTCGGRGTVQSACPVCVGLGYIVEVMGRTGSIEHSSGPKCKRCDGLGEVTVRCAPCGGSGVIVTRG